MVVHSAHRLHMPSLLPADPLTPYLTPHNKLQCRLLAILDTPTRLVALTKPNSNGYRPIAVGELFYRLAAIVAVRRVSSEAAALFTPHQYGFGVTEWSGEDPALVATRADG